MNNNTTIISTNLQRDCSHGLLLDTHCIFCLQEGVYFRKDAEAYQKFYKKSNSVSFELAFEIAKRIQIWRETTKDNILENYFKGLEKTQKLAWSINTIKKAYYLTRDFSDLAQEENRKCPFSIYREIANAKISNSQKQELRSRVETEDPTLYQTRDFIKESKGLELTQKEAFSQLKERIIFTNQGYFISQVREFISRQTGLKKGQTIIVRICKQKERIKK